MVKTISSLSITVLVLLIVLSGCSRETDMSLSPAKGLDEDVSTIAAKNSKGYVRYIIVNLDGDDYYLDGPPDGPNGAKDVPGHTWTQAGPNQILGKHYNTGPNESPKWWSSNAPDGEFLYKVQGIIDTWSSEKAEAYASRGYVHYHEFVKVSNNELHPTKVLWLKHTARTRFTLDGGPGAPNPPYEHDVKPGIDYEFPNNYSNPYTP